MRVTLKGEVRTLAQAKAERITESKQLLHDFLAEHPWTSTVKGGEARKYTVTQDKQNYLTSELMLAQGATTAGMEYTAKWNSAGQPCEEWELPELMQLSYEIAAYVKPFVSRQQDIEVAIGKCKTVAKVDAVVIDYSEVLTE
jgi:hypothetical protein